ncbi:MAG: hemolysin protein [Planctomycetota bacterium]|nr:MAG: hemolysin protein [Planctomycetota bacterium]
MLALALFAVALLMNAFFSGTETGFFRMTRLRLVMEAKAGDPWARILLWFANQPSVFVATALVGNNVANDLTSYSVVAATQSVFPAGGTLSAVLPPLLVTPLMFICGDLLPKNVFYNAPNRLMRRAAPAIVVAAVLFAPVTFVLWLLSLALALFTREEPQQIRMSLARRELSSILVEGHEAGILSPVQRNLAQTMLAVAGRPVRDFATPAGRVVRVTTSMSRGEILRIAQRHRRTLLPIDDARNKRQVIGFVRTVDLIVGDAESPIQPLPFVELSAGETFLSALSKLSVAKDALGRVSDAAGRTIGFVTGRELRQVLDRVQ